MKRLGRVVTQMAGSFDPANSATYQIDDNEFHLAFFTACGNTLPREAYELFLPRIRALLTNLSSPEPYLLEQSFLEHREILNSLSQGQVDPAVEMLTEHIARTEAFHPRQLAVLGDAAPGKGRSAR